MGYEVIKWLHPGICVVACPDDEHAARIGAITTGSLPSIGTSLLTGRTDRSTTRRKITMNSSVRNEIDLPYAEGAHRGRAAGGRSPVGDTPFSRFAGLPAVAIVCAVGTTHHAMAGMTRSYVRGLGVETGPPRVGWVSPEVAAAGWLQATIASNTPRMAPTLSM